MPWDLAHSRTSLVLDAGGRAAAALRPRRRAAGDLAGVADVAAERLAQGGGVGVVEVDLVRRAVEAERDGLGGLGAVEIVDQDDVDLLCHGNSFAFVQRGNSGSCSIVGHAQGECQNGLTGKSSGIAFEHQPQTLERQPRRMHGETPAIVDQQRRQMAGGNDGDVLGRLLPARRSSAPPGPRPGPRRRRPFRSAVPRRCSSRSPSAGGRARPCAAAHRGGRAPRGRSRCRARSRRRRTGPWR